MSDSANLPQALFGLGTGDVVYAASIDKSGVGDVYCDTFTVNGSTNLTFYNNRIVARKKITVSGASVIRGDGLASTNVGTGSGAINVPAGILSTLIVGAAGGDGANGTGAGTAAAAFSTGRGIGGAGGAGGSTNAHIGGAGGSLTNTSAISSQYLDFYSIVRGWTVMPPNVFYYLSGGSGGGGGACDSSGGGGGGGAGGNVLYLAAPIIEIAGGIHCNGGAGADAVSPGEACGGGGGGGGTIILIYNELILSGSITVAGGAGGAGINGGDPGATGGAGHVYHINGLSTQLGPVV